MLFKLSQLNFLLQDFVFDQKVPLRTTTRDVFSLIYKNKIKIICLTMISIGISQTSKAIAIFSELLKIKPFCLIFT